MVLPKLGLNGLLPPGVHRATPGDVRWAFGVQSFRRMVLMKALDKTLEHARKAGIRRVLLNGSFVTAKEKPGDVDMVVRTTAEYGHQLAGGEPDAVWIVGCAEKPHPKRLNLFIAPSEEEWKTWVRFFEQDTWHGRKGLVEVTL